MTDRIRMDVSQVGKVAVEIDRAAKGIVGALRPVVEAGAGQVKDQLRAEMSASTHFKGVARGIDYDLSLDGLSAEIGPRPGKPGSLANIAYFGSSRGGGTVPDPLGALEAQAPRFEEAVLDAVERLLP